MASFVAAVLLAFYSLYLSQVHNIIAESCMLVAQFLLLTASIFGIDYKFNSPYDYNPRAPWVSQQQPPEHQEEHAGVSR